MALIYVLMTPSSGVLYKSCCLSRATLYRLASKGCLCGVCPIEHDLLTRPLQKRPVLDDSHCQTCGEHGKENRHEATGRRLACPAAGDGRTRLIGVVGLSHPSFRAALWHGL